MTRLVPTGGMPVDSWTLPAILEAEEVRPDDISLVKIDVEGYEFTLMPQLGPWLAERQVPVCVAFHRRQLDQGWFRGYANVTERIEARLPNGEPLGQVTALPELPA